MNILTAVLCSTLCWTIIFGFSVDISSVSKSRVRRIINGQPTKIFKFPWQVRIDILIGKNGSCGGSIIGDEWVLTAAHCLYGRSKEKLKIVSGGTDFDGDSKHDVEESILFERYNITGLEQDDIALIRVSPKFTFGKSTQPIQMIEAGVELEDDTPITVSGWGQTEHQNFSDVLREGGMFVINNTRCKEIVSTVETYELADTQLCIQYTKERKSVCNGDSGGPCVTQDQKLVGVISGAFECGKNRTPSVCTKVSHYRDWIKKNSGI